MAQARLVGSLDRMAIGASLACLAHCLALPVLFAALPFLATVLPIPESFHLWMIALAVPASMLALVGGRARHRSPYPIFVGIIGLGALLGATQVVSTNLEIALTAVGSVTLVTAHLLNWRLRAA